MKLIVGIGNYEKKYNNTRHNVGFGFLDYYIKNKSLIFNNSKFDAEYVHIMVDGEKVLIIKPLTYVNLSGEAVIKFMKYYNIALSDLLVIHDDLDLEIGRIKVVYNSSSGGHNGIKSIENCLNSKEYLRLKIGVGNNKKIDTKDYVLGHFNNDESKVIINSYEKLINFIDDFCVMTKENLMNKYNKK